MAIDREKLIKILRMFGSDHTGEVASAARRAHELLKNCAMDWEDLIIKPGANNSSNNNDSNTNSKKERKVNLDEFDLINECQARSGYLTEWEREFIDSISLSIHDWGGLTDKQRTILNRIINKVRAYGRWER